LNYQGVQNAATLVDGRYVVTERCVVVRTRCFVVERKARKALMAA